MFEHGDPWSAVRLEGGQPPCLSPRPPPVSFLARGTVQPASSPAHSRLVAAVSGRKGNWCLSRQRQWGVPFPFFVWGRASQPLGDPKLPRDRQHVTRETTGREGSQPAGQRSSHSETKLADGTAIQDRFQTSAQGPRLEGATNGSREYLPPDEANPRPRLLGDDKTFSHISKLVLEEGSDAWWKLEVKDLLPEIYRCAAFARFGRCEAHFLGRRGKTALQGSSHLNKKQRSMFAFAQSFLCTREIRYTRVPRTETVRSNVLDGARLSEACHTLTRRKPGPLAVSVRTRFKLKAWRHAAFRP